MVGVRQYGQIPLKYVPSSFKQDPVFVCHPRNAVSSIKVQWCSWLPIGNNVHAAQEDGNLPMVSEFEKQLHSQSISRSTTAAARRASLPSWLLSWRYHVCGWVCFWVECAVHSTKDPIKNHDKTIVEPHTYFPASGQAVVTGVVPSPPRFLPSIFLNAQMIWFRNPTARRLFIECC